MPRVAKQALDMKSIITFAGSMLFVVIFAHVSTRSRIAAQDIFSLEDYYFALYLTLVWVAVSAILFMMGRNARRSARAPGCPSRSPWS